MNNARREQLTQLSTVLHHFDGPSDNHKFITLSLLIEKLWLKTTRVIEQSCTTLYCWLKRGVCHKNSYDVSLIRSCAVRICATRWLCSKVTTVTAVINNLSCYCHQVFESRITKILSRSVSNAALIDTSQPSVTAYSSRYFRKCFSE